MFIPESLEKKTALTTALIAVCLAVSSILGGNAGADMILHRGDANHRWNYFQAKGVKEGLCQVSSTLLEIHLMEVRSERARAEIKAKLEASSRETARYAMEKREIKAEAERFEQAARIAGNKADIYDLAEGLYQIAIVVAAMAVITKMRRLWDVSCLIGLMGLIFSGRAFLIP